MININVKRKQNGEVTSNIKEVVKIYSTFNKYEQANKSFDNLDLQQRLKPLDVIESDSELVTGSFTDDLDNIRLQQFLYQDLKLDTSTSNAKINKITQVWVFINDKIRKIFSLISSCFGSGIWMSSEKWVDTELWKY